MLLISIDSPQSVSNWPLFFTMFRTHFLMTGSIIYFFNVLILQFHMKDFTEARNNFTHIKFNIYFHVLLFMIHLQSYQILIHEGKSLVLLSFLNFLIKRRSKIKTNIMILVQGLPKHKTILKNEKKNGTGYSFQKKKRCFLLSAGNTQKNWKRFLAFLRPFTRE